MPSELSLAKKLSEVAEAVGRVPKNGYNSFHKYQYVLEADLVDHIRPLLAERRVTIIPTVKEFNRAGSMTEVLYEYLIVDGDSGETLTTSSIGFGDDKGDKGAYKASTGAFKYMLMRLFMVATGDDPEGDERTDQRAAGGSGPSVNISSSSAKPVGRGGRSDGVTSAQIATIKNTSKELGLGIEGMARLIDRVLGDSLVLPEAPTAAASVISDYLDALSGEDAGKLIGAMVAAAPKSPEGFRPAVDGIDYDSSDQ